MGPMGFVEVWLVIVWALAAQYSSRRLTMNIEDIISAVQKKLGVQVDGRDKGVRALFLDVPAGTSNQHTGAGSTTELARRAKSTAGSQPSSAAILGELILKLWAQYIRPKPLRAGAEMAHCSMLPYTGTKRPAWINVNSRSRDCWNDHDHDEICYLYAKHRLRGFIGTAQAVSSVA